jgi:hypothetical protein
MAIQEKALALEEYVRAGVDQEKVLTAFKRMLELAATGNVKAWASVAPYLLTKPTVAEETDKEAPTFVFKIENATIGAHKQGVVVDGTVESSQELTNG